MRDEIRAASLQFVRKISGFNKPSKANEAVVSSLQSMKSQPSRLVFSHSLEKPTRPRKIAKKEAAKAKARAAERFSA